MSPEHPALVADARPAAEPQVMLVGGCHGLVVIEQTQWRGYCDGIALVLVCALLLLSCYGIAAWLSAASG